LNQTLKHSETEAAHFTVVNGARLGVLSDSHLRQSEERRKSRKPPVADRLAIWISTSRTVDGLWLGTTESKPHPALRRVEEALQLIRHQDQLQYARVIHNLERIWVNLIPSALAYYDPPLKACVLDERFVLPEATTLERIASTIVHEATHARMERWGISYIDEKERPRIEAICLRRELSFVAKLSGTAALQEEIAQTLEWCVSDDDYFSNVSFQQRHQQGMIETARYVGIPDRIIDLLLRLRAVISLVRQWTRSLIVRRDTCRDGTSSVLTSKECPQEEARSPPGTDDVHASPRNPIAST
jgi:hypothetical protein